METFAGLGFTIGPPIGGVLYQIGGFKLPFLSFGIVLVFVAIIAHIYIENIGDEAQMSSKGMIGMLHIPLIWLMSYAVISCAMSLSFLDPTIANHMETFKLTPLMIGCIFFLSGGIYTITAPIWGIIVDRFHCDNLIMLLGSAAIVISMLMIGPSPIFKTEKNIVLIIIAMSVLEIAAGALYIPTFQACINAVREGGYDDSLQTYSNVSGLFHSAFSLGSFLGPTIGGLTVEWIGFEWTATVIAFINLIFMSVMLTFISITNFTDCYRSTRIWTQSQSQSSEKN